MRLEAEGPVGYGKAGSFEGFCSGGGIARLARRSMAETHASRAGRPRFCADAGALDSITAKRSGVRRERWRSRWRRRSVGIVGRKLGRGLAVLMDLLNPERIVIGSIYGRQKAMLEPIVHGGAAREALPLSRVGVRDRARRTGRACRRRGQLT